MAFVPQETLSRLGALEAMLNQLLDRQVGLGPTGGGRARMDSQMEKVAADVEQENDELRQEMIEMKMDLAEKEMELSELRNDKAQLQSQLTKAREDETSTKRDLETLVQQKGELQLENSGLQETIETLEEEKHELYAAKEELYDRCEQLEDDIDQLQRSTKDIVQVQAAKSAANTAPKKVRDSSATPLSPRISTPHSSSPGSGPQNSCLCNHRNPHPHLIAPTVQPHLAGGMSTRVSMPNNTSSPPIAEGPTPAAAKKKGFFVFG